MSRFTVLALLLGCIWVLPSCGLDVGGDIDSDGASIPQPNDGAQLDQRSDSPSSNAVDSAAE